MLFQPREMLGPHAYHEPGKIRYSHILFDAGEKIEYIVCEPRRLIFRQHELKVGQHVDDGDVVPW